MSWLPPYGRGSDLGVFGVSCYGDGPLSRWFAWPIHRFRTKFLDPTYYWFYYRFTEKGRQCWIPKGLKPGYSDQREMILDSCFGALASYVEEMGGIESIEVFNEDLRKPGADGYGPDGVCARQADRQEEAVNLYTWWVVHLPAKQAEIDRLSHEAFLLRKGPMFGPPEVMGDGVVYEMIPAGGERQELYKQSWRLEEELATETQAMLHRLIDIREGLWV